MIKDLLDREPLVAFEAVKVLAVFAVVRLLEWVESVIGPVPLEVKVAVVSLAFAGLVRVQRSKVWSPAGVRALAHKIASGGDE